jgi:hypothetical protein
MVPAAACHACAKDLRRPGWQDEVAAPGQDQGISVYRSYSPPGADRQPGPAVGPCRSVRTPSCNGKLPGRRQVLLRITITGSPSGDNSPS